MKLKSIANQRIIQSNILTTDTEGRNIISCCDKLNDLKVTLTNWIL